MRCTKFAKYNRWKKFKSLFQTFPFPYFIPGFRHKCLCQKCHFHPFIFSFNFVIRDIIVRKHIDKDEEFNAQGNILFDYSATDFNHVESAVSTAEIGVRRLAEIAGLPLQGHSFGMQ